MPNNMTAQDKMALTMQVYNSIFTSKQNGIDIVTVSIFHSNIVNGTPLLNGQVRVGGQVQGRWFKDSVTGQAIIRGFDIDLSTDGKILQLRFIEQNPNKVDAMNNLKPMAIAARKGSKIMWLIDRKAKVGENGFLGRVQDGTFKPSQDNAVRPVQKSNIVTQMLVKNQPPIASQIPNDEEVAEDMLWEEDTVPEMGDTGIPEHVVKYYANMEPGDESEFVEY